VAFSQGLLADFHAGDVAQMKLRVLDLFSGIGGFSLGLERTGGFETVAFCENNKARWPVLQKHWRGIPIYPDVRRLPNDFVVDLVTAGFPCQDISLAGKGAGLAGRRSRLFWRIIRTAGLVGWPRLLLENVAALLDRGLGTVLGALAQVGYDTQWHCIPASAVGAPHRRDRIWIVADPQRDKQPWTEPCVGPFGRMGRVEQSVAWDGGWEAALSSLRGMDDGLSRSVDRTDGLRNAVVPQVVTAIGNVILSEAA
jgi:DNA (cytosine-5)-methyltransferase 1